ncbi:MAG: HAMP domain-containing histidine kinase [Bacillus subtilis]|nr:HAMP domain-containing histidine kinase [Bacillus subtilis]
MSNAYLYVRFADRYVEENIEAVKQAILESAATIQSQPTLNSDLLRSASSETQFIRYQNGQIVDQIGPSSLQANDLLLFVIALYDNPKLMTDGKLSYTIQIVDDLHHISYIYRYGNSDYLLVLTKIQSLRNIDRVLNDITTTQGIVLFVLIAMMSYFLSKHVTSPIKRINRYAKAIANLDFATTLRLERKDEFRELVGSLNEMAFNLQKSYSELDAANRQLTHDIEFEKQQETKKKQLIMTINHELRTPLAVIKGMVEGMIDRVGRYVDTPTYLKEVLKQLDEIDKKTKDLTYSLRLEDLAKLDDSTNLLTLKEALAPLQELATQRKVKLTIDIIDQSIRINAELLGILVSNLVKNAINYTKDGHVDVKTFVNEEACFLEVRNRGFIDAEDLQKIFQPYYRANAEVEGSGLGLFIVKQICEIYRAECKIFNDNGDVVAKIVFRT